MSSIFHQQIGLRQTAPNTYEVAPHDDWAMGPTIHGGCVAAVIHYAMVKHMSSEPSLAKLNQPDVLKMHLQYIRSCGMVDSTIVVTPLKIGAGISALQLHLSQKSVLRVIALITMTNFTQSLGPSAPSDWKLLPPPKPIPDFDCIAANKAEPRWVSGCVDGELFPLSRRVVVLEPRGDFPENAIYDAWNGFKDGERMDATYIAMMTDFCPSMSDTLMRNGGPYDAHGNHQKTEAWAEKNPGVVHTLRPTIADAFQAKTFNATVTLDMEFKQRLPEGGLRWVFTRTETKKLEAGRMDLDITICNEQMEVVCVAHQLILVLEAQKKFRTEKTRSAL